jgi:outer membrane protein TolC
MRPTARPTSLPDSPRSSRAIRGFERQVAERLTTPMPTFGVDGGNTRREIPVGSFRGAPPASGLAGLSGLPGVSAVWTDPEVALTVTVPIPLFDRQREARARTSGRILTAESRLAIVRADVQSELASAWESLQAARRAVHALGQTPAVMARDVGFVEQAVRAGAFDAVTRTQALRRLEESGRRVDTAVRDLRAARAAWIRRAGAQPF